MAHIRRDMVALAGYVPSLPTPFDATGNIDRPAFEHLCAWHVEAGAPALVVASGIGEAPTLSATEHRVLIHIAVDVARGKVPVIAGAGSNSTAHAIELTHDAERLGADAVISVVPYYNKPGQAGLIAHFNAIRRATTLPIILHDAPSRCAMALGDATIAQLAHDTQFIGLLDASGDVTRPARLRPLVGPRFLLFSGDDPTAFAYQALGGDGCISATAAVVPNLCRDLSRVLRQGDMVLAQRLAVTVNQLAAVVTDDSEPVPVKFALSLIGLMAPRVRLPLVELSASRKAEIAAPVMRIRQEELEARAPARLTGQHPADRPPDQIGGIVELSRVGAHQPRGHVSDSR